MKYFSQLCLVFLVISIPLLGAPPSHLILYFDINKTLIASDKAGNKSTEDVLNELLAEKYEAYWDESLQEPMTFDDYVYDVMVPGSRDDLTLRPQAKSYLQHFVHYLKEQHHPLYGTVLQDYEKALSVLNTANGAVFPSFYALLNKLDRKGISYSIILRSFGEEVFEVKAEINTLHQNMFSRTGKFRQGKLLLEEDEPVEGSQAIYNQLRRIEHTAINDDWSYWNTHGESAMYGKPFYIDRNDHETLSIFFDDNIREEDSNKNIVTPLDAVTGESIPIQELVLSGEVVRVDTLEAILDSDYYIERVEEAIDKHTLKDNAVQEATCN